MSLSSTLKQEMYGELVSVHNECVEFIKNNDFTGYSKFVKKQLKENRETFKINKLRLILLASKDSQDIRVQGLCQKVHEEYAKIIKSFDPPPPKVKKQKQQKVNAK